MTYALPILCLWTVSFFFAGIEAGLLSINPVRLRHHVKQLQPSALRLDRLTQHGDLFNATFTGLPGFPHPELVTGVAVEVSTIRGSTPEVFGVSDVTTHRLDAGFMVQGRLQSGAGRIVELRLTRVDRFIMYSLLAASILAVILRLLGIGLITRNYL